MGRESKDDLISPLNDDIVWVKTLAVMGRGLLKVTGVGLEVWSDDETLVAGCILIVRSIRIALMLNLNSILGYSKSKFT